MIHTSKHKYVCETTNKWQLKMPNIPIVCWFTNSFAADGNGINANQWHLVHKFHCSKCSHQYITGRALMLYTGARTFSREAVNYVSWLTDQPTPLNTVIHEKLTGPQPVKKFPAFYGACIKRRFIAKWVFVTGAGRANQHFYSTDASFQKYRPVFSPQYIILFHLLPPLTCPSTRYAIARPSILVNSRLPTSNSATV